MTEEIKQLLEKKSNEDLSIDDRDTLSSIEVILSNPNWFNMIDPEMAINILTFIGLSEKKAINYYFDLKLKPNEYDKYILFDSKFFEKK